MLVHPVIAESYARALGESVSVDHAAPDLPAVALKGDDLLRRFAEISDGRRGQGRDHPVAVVLTLSAAAVLAGMKSFTAIAGWVADVPAHLLAQLHGRPAEAGSTITFPSKSTVWRVLTGAAAVGAWLFAQASAQLSDDHAGVGAHDNPEEPALVAIAVDGKTVRGAVDTDDAQTHLLAGATHNDSLVLGQVEVGTKSNEIPMFAPLLGGLAAAGVDLRDTVITADALHAQRAHAEYLHSVGAEFVLTAKLNQPRLFAALDALPWAATPVAHREVETGHGRVTTRTIQVLPAPTDLPFPRVNQVWLIERYVTDHTGAPVSAVAALGVTSLTAQRSAPGPPRSPRSSADTGASSRCTGCATPSTARTTPPPAPAPDPASWPCYATSPSALCTCSDAATSSKPPAAPPASWTDHSRSSSSHDLGTPVGPQAPASARSSNL